LIAILNTRHVTRDGARIGAQDFFDKIHNEAFPILDFRFRTGDSRWRAQIGQLFMSSTGNFWASSHPREF
jgi:hypothetical protein